MTTEHTPEPTPVVERYDAGLLSDFGGGNVEWWWDYIRSELASAHDFYAILAASPKPALTQGGVVELVERLRACGHRTFFKHPTRSGRSQTEADLFNEAATALERLAATPASMTDMMMPPEAIDEFTSRPEVVADIERLAGENQYGGQGAHVMNPPTDRERPALSSCPFCGCSKIERSEYRPTKEITLFCSACKAGVSRARGASQTTREAWNTRAAPQPLSVDVERERIVWPDDVLDRVEEWVNRKGGDADVRDIAAALIAAAHPALGGGDR